MVLPSNTCVLYSLLSVLGIFVGPPIREVLTDEILEDLINLNVSHSLSSFKSICHSFLGNTRVPDYRECIKLLQAYEYMECRMSLKIHFSLPTSSLNSKQ